MQTASSSNYPLIRGKMIKKLLYYGKKLLSFSFNGRASRKEYAIGFFCDFVTLIGSWIIISALLENFAKIGIFVCNAIIFLLLAARQTRRVHDFSPKNINIHNKANWNCFFFEESDEGENKLASKPLCWQPKREMYQNKDFCCAAQKCGYCLY